MPLASAEMACCFHKTQVPALLNEGPSDATELLPDWAFRGSLRARRREVASAGLLSPRLLKKTCVMVVKQCCYKLGTCFAPVALVPLMRRLFWLIL